MSILEKPIIIAGPCAAENQHQVNTIAEFLQELNKLYSLRLIMRASLWKPRTRPGWDGVGQEGIPWLIEAAQNHRLTLATEVLLPEHLTAIIENWEKQGKPNINIIPWLGARNQNHLIVREMTKLLNSYPQLFPAFLVKNQPWPSFTHWSGMVEHVLSTGFPREKLILCYRGNVPYPNTPNPNTLRNPIIWDEVYKIRQAYPNMPILCDPSHIAGRREMVTPIAQKALSLKDRERKPIFDGLMVEVHPNPAKALTDAAQQLDPDSFKQLLTQAYSTP